MLNYAKPAYFFKTPQLLPHSGQYNKYPVPSESARLAVSQEDSSTIPAVPDIQHVVVLYKESRESLSLVCVKETQRDKGTKRYKGTKIQRDKET